MLISRKEEGGGLRSEIERRRIKKEINVEECIFSSNAKKMPFCFVRKNQRENPEKKREKERTSEEERTREGEVREQIF